MRRSTTTRWARFAAAARRHDGAAPDPARGVAATLLRAPAGTRIRWRLSEPARVRLRVDRVRPGFRRGGRCVARRPPRVGSGAACASGASGRSRAWASRDEPRCASTASSGAALAPGPPPLTASRATRPATAGTPSGRASLSSPVASLIAVRRYPAPRRGGMSHCGARAPDTRLSSGPAARPRADRRSRDGDLRRPRPARRAAAPTLQSACGMRRGARRRRDARLDEHVGTARRDASSRPPTGRSRSSVSTDASAGGCQPARRRRRSSSRPATSARTASPTTYSAVTRPLAPAQRCGSGTVAETSLFVVDGRTGETSSPFGALRDICWTRFNYPTQQWSSGTVYIGEFTKDYLGPEVVVVPVLRDSRPRMEPRRDRPLAARAHTDGEQFAFPSTPAFDREYNAANPAPCSAPVPGGPATPEFARRKRRVPGGRRGRAVRAHELAGGGLPTRPDADIRHRVVAGRQPRQRWAQLRPGRDVPGGRRHLRRPHRRLLDAQSLARDGAGRGPRRRRRELRHRTPLRALPARRSQIAQHESVYYGYLGTHGALEGRVEFPARPRAALGGAGTSWTAFNLVRSGSWSAQVFTGPMSTQPMELPGWYVWDTVELPDGGAGLLASRVPPEACPLLGARRPALERVDNLRLGPAHSGRVPVLVPYASTPTRHTSETSFHGAYVGPGSRARAARRRSCRRAALREPRRGRRRGRVASWP